MQEKLIKLLIDLGLSDKEAKVYLAFLSLKKGTITRAAKISGIKRTTVYSLLESLKNKGLINIEIQGWKQYYVAESPKKLEILLEEKKKTLLENISDLEAIQGNAEKGGFIRYYEGLEASKSAYEDLLKNLKKDDFYYSIGGGEKWVNSDKRYFHSYIKRRARLNKKAKIIVNKSKTVDAYKVNQQLYGEEIKILANDKFISTNFIITPSTMIIHNLDMPVMTIVIENDSVINLQKMLFELIWGTL